jgi:hypothetical protein
MSGLSWGRERLESVAQNVVNVSPFLVVQQDGTLAAGLENVLMINMTADSDACSGHAKHAYNILAHLAAGPVTSHATSRPMEATTRVKNNNTCAESVAQTPLVTNRVKDLRLHVKLNAVS